jgi:hypothetical protein
VTAAIDSELLQFLLFVCVFTGCHLIRTFIATVAMSSYESSKLVLARSLLVSTLSILLLLTGPVQGGDRVEQLAAELGDLLQAGPVTGGSNGGSGGAQVISGIVGPPRRPDSFRSLDELNQYLAEMRQFYSMLGRPRFGRSVDRSQRHRRSFVDFLQSRDMNRRAQLTSP